MSSITLDDIRQMLDDLGPPAPRLQASALCAARQGRQNPAAAVAQAAGRSGRSDLRQPREIFQMIPDCYDYVRRYYHVEAYIGKRVRVKGRGEGALVAHKRGDQYLYIRFDDEPGVVGPFHPTDGVEYLPLIPRTPPPPALPKPGA